MHGSRIGFLVALATAVLAFFPSAASAHVDPPGCNAGGLNFQFTNESGLAIVHRNDDHLELAVRIRNDAPQACTVDDATVSIQTPAPDGTPGPLVPVTTDADFLGGMPQLELATKVPYDVSLNEGVFRAPMTISVSGTAHYADVDSIGLVGSFSTPLVISRPRVNLQVARNPGSGPAPLSVTYTYNASNVSPVDPGVPPNPTPDLASPTNDTAIISDDTCSPLTFTGGDTTPTFPPLLQEGETWTFTCTRLFGDQGTFTSTAGIVGNSTRDGRPWPATTAQTSVTAQGSDMTIAKSHDGEFAAGEGGRAYTLVATNSGNAASSGSVTVADQLPAGLTATAISGEGWSCALETVSCTRSDPLAGGASYPPITVSVDVGADAAAEVVNTASVAGGGELRTNNNTASDPTTITRAPGPEPPGAGPSNEFAIGKSKSKGGGKASLVVTVPGPGEVTADDPPKGGPRLLRAKLSNLVKAASATATAAGPTTLRLKLTNAAKRKLEDRRSKRAKVSVTYTPTGGTAASQTTRVKFKLG